jgi:hypothetical protein
MDSFYYAQLSSEQKSTAPLRTLLTENLSVDVMFRVIEKHCPTLFLLSVGVPDEWIHWGRFLSLLFGQ